MTWLQWRHAAAIHPLIVCVTGFVSALAATGTPLWGIWRPLLVLICAVLVVQAAMVLATRSLSLGSLAATIALTALAAVWIVALPLLGMVGWWVVVNFARRRRGRPVLGAQFLRDRSADLGLFSLAMLAVVLAPVVAGGVFWQPVKDRPADPTSASAPNVYLLMLDGYPRSDVLASRFGIDNALFVDALAARGFTVSPESRSNYSTTWLTLASMSQMDYVHTRPEIAALGAHDPRQYGRLGQMLNDSPALRMLRDAGYRIVANPAAYPELALVNADRTFEPVGLTWFEEFLAEKTVVPTILSDAWRGLMADQERRSVETALERAIEVAGDSADQPVFFFDHVFSPHPPFVFESNGSARAPQACFPAKCSLRAPSLERLGMSQADYATALAGQIEWLNSRVLATIDMVVQRDPTGVIIVFSDHATRYDTAGDPSEAVLNFFAARTPAKPALFGDQPSPVNLFSVLLDSYLGTNLPIRDYQGYLSVDDWPLSLRPID